jgi:carotenoid cleavage dioxygenase
MLPVELDGELQSLRYGYFNDERSLPFSAHPHRDPLTGALHAVCYDATDPRHLRYVVVDRQGRVETAQTIPVSHGPMVHDCAITRSRLVVLDLPVTFTLSAVLKGAAFPYAWNPRHPARVGLMPKGGSAADLVWCEVDPCFVFHTCNAFDNEDGTVTLDAVVHERMFDHSRQGPELGERRVRFERWRIDPRTRRVTRECIDEREQEFPRFDERLTGEPYRHAYSISFDTGSRTGPTPNALHALDLRTGRVQVRDFGAGHWPSEAIFVPRHEGAAEQEGWLLTLVTTDRDASLHVLDAADITGATVAKVTWPTRVPLGFHANWIPQIR